MSTKTQERWVKVQPDGGDGKFEYEVSDHGKVKRTNTRKNESKIMKPTHIKDYEAVSIKFDKSKIALVHRLVAEHFVEREDTYLTHVIHLDYDKKNNHYSNLKWVTKDQLFAHLKMNPNAEPKKRRATNMKLTEDQVREIKKILKEGKIPVYRLSKQYGVTHTQVNRIRSGENWGHVTID